MMNKRSIIIGFVLLLPLVFVPVLWPRPAATRAQSVVTVAKYPEAQVQQRLDAMLYDYKVYHLDLPTIEYQARSTGQTRLEFGSQVFDMVLEPNDLRAPVFRQTRTTDRGVIEEPQSPVSTFKGSLSDDPQSIVRLLILPDLVQGYVRTAEDWIFIDPVLKFAPHTKSTDVVIFREADIRPEAVGVCGAGMLDEYAERLHSRSTIRTQSENTGEALKQAEIATDADFEYFQIFGGNTNTQIQGIINQVDGIYQTDHSVTLTMTFQNVYTTSSDPYTSSNASTLLSQFRSFWNANHGGVNRDLAHLFTGRNVDGGIIGIAYVGVVCNDPAFSYGLSQNYSLMTKLTAHEIGHNFDALHDDEVTPPGGVCNGSGPIMCSFIQSNGSNAFSSRSRTDIANHVNAHSNCLTNVGGPPPPPPPPPPPTCAAETAMESSAQRDSALVTLRRLRDDVFPRSLQGRQFVQMFNAHTAEVSWMLLQDSDLRATAQHLIERLLPSFEAVAAGRSTTISRGDITQIEQFLMSVRRGASPALQRTIDSVLGHLRDPRVLSSFGVTVR